MKCIIFNIFYTTNTLLKKVIIIATLFIFLHESTLSNKLKKHKIKLTPKGYNLINHYGISKFNNIYGSNSSLDDYNNKNHSSSHLSYHDYHRIKNKFNNIIVPKEKSLHSLNPSPYKSGEFNNIAPDYKTDINPILVNPKLELASNYNSKIFKKNNVYLGTNKELIDVYAHDKKNNRIFEDKLLVNTPKFMYKNEEINIPTIHKHQYDIKTGHLVSHENNIKYHGFNTIK